MMFQTLITLFVLCGIELGFAYLSISFKKLVAMHMECVKSAFTREFWHFTRKIRAFTREFHTVPK
jgi:hypothetical protein